MLQRAHVDTRLYKVQISGSFDISFIWWTAATAHPKTDRMKAFLVLSLAAVAMSSGLRPLQPPYQPGLAPYQPGGLPPYAPGPAPFLPPPAPYQPLARAPYVPSPAPYAPLPPPPYPPKPYGPPAVLPYDDQPYDEPAAYNFGYAVQDSYSGVDFSANEERNGPVTNGGYRVQLPDGRTQIVTYNVADGSGFVADVKYEGEAVYGDAVLANKPYGPNVPVAPYAPAVPYKPVAPIVPYKPAPVLPYKPAIAPYRPPGPYAPAVPIYN